MTHLRVVLVKPNGRAIVGLNKARQCMENAMIDYGFRLPTGAKLAQAISMHKTLKANHNNGWKLSIFRERRGLDAKRSEYAKALMYHGYYKPRRQAPPVPEAYTIDINAIQTRVAEAVTRARR